MVLAESKVPSQTGQIRLSIAFLLARAAVRHSGEQKIRRGLMSVVNSFLHCGQVRWTGMRRRFCSRQVGEQNT
ncbi:hypothetical protein [Streptomyces sp. A0592]|uniref:hypothetical protein n=1 Tax=Streptomyces sp. A0592 TaxID=2563099 RepID=UPI00113A416A|nr:hypothetical protein [Streptomyces sp. A0592]THA80265.1 hypothetical protein E6U81_29160 [Streptomyces sp. A0592]